MNSTADDVPRKGVNYFMLNSAKYNGHGRAQGVA